MKNKFASYRGLEAHITRSHRKLTRLCGHPQINADGADPPSSVITMLCDTPSVRDKNGTCWVDRSRWPDTPQGPGDLDCATCGRLALATTELLDHLAGHWPAHPSPQKIVRCQRWSRGANRAQSWEARRPPQAPTTGDSLQEAPQDAQAKDAADRTGSSQRPNGGEDAMLELLDAVVRLSLNSQQQSRKLCVTVWDFALLPLTAATPIRINWAPQNQSVTMGILVSLSTQRRRQANPQKTLEASWHSSGAAQRLCGVETTVADQGDREGRQGEGHGDAGGGGSGGSRTHTHRRA